LLFLLLLERLDLAAQSRSLARFVDSCADGSGEGCSNDCFLQCSHGDGFDGGCSCSGSDGCSAQCAAVEMVTASPTGAAWTALAEMTTTSPLAPT